jgi:hypothetical protein
MAKKARKKAAPKRKKTKVQAVRRPARAKARKAAPKRKAAAKKRARKPRTFGQRIANAVRTVVGTVEDTEKLRAKLEQRGSDATE